MNARVQSVVLFAFGAVLVRLAGGVELLRYVRPSSRPWVLAAGLLMIALGGTDLCVAGSYSGSTRGRPSGIAWAVLAPVFAVLLVAPPALGSFTALRSRPVIIDPRRADYPPLPPGETTALSTIDFVSRALTRGGDTLTGRTVALTGFVLRRQVGGFVLSRLVITCCAADAAPVDISVLDRAAAPPVDSWVTVTGTAAGVEQTSGEPRARIVAHRVAAVAPPRNPYEH